MQDILKSIFNLTPKLQESLCLANGADLDMPWTIITIEIPFDLVDFNLANFQSIAHQDKYK